MLLFNIALKTALLLLPLKFASAKLVSKLVTSSDGTRIYAEGQGNPANPAIVLIPGFMLGSLVFDGQFEDKELTKDIFLVRYDPRGHGQSDKPEISSSYDSRLFSDDFVAVSEAFGLKKPVVAGWSLGGIIAADVVAHAGPNYISGAILLASTIPFDPDLSNLLPPNILAILQGLLSTDDVALHKRSVVAFGDTLFSNPSAIPFNTRMSWLGTTLLQPPGASQLAPTRRQDPEPFLQAGKNGLKLLVLEGEKDQHRMNTTAAADTLRPYFKDLELVVFEGAGHAFFYEQPKRVNRALRNFVNRVASSSRSIRGRS